MGSNVIAFNLLQKANIKQILYQYKMYYNISDPEEDQGGTSSEIQKGHPKRDGLFLYNRHLNTLWMNICYKLSLF